MAAPREEEHICRATAQIRHGSSRSPAGAPAAERTKAEMNEGKKALTNVEERTKAEMEVGKRSLAGSRSPPDRSVKHDEEETSTLRVTVGGSYANGNDRGLQRHDAAARPSAAAG